MLPAPAAAAAASSSSAAASSVVAPSDEWIVPDFVITEPTQRRLVAILVSLREAYTKFDLEALFSAAVHGALSNVAEANLSIEQLHSRILREYRGVGSEQIRQDVEQMRQTWRSQVTMLARWAARNGAATASPVNSSAAPSAAAASASGPHEWVVPDLPITDDNRLRIAAVLAKVKPLFGGPSRTIGILRSAVLDRSVRSIRELGQFLEVLHSDTLKGYPGSIDIADVNWVRQEWRSIASAASASLVKPAAATAATSAPPKTMMTAARASPSDAASAPSSTAPTPRVAPAAASTAAASSSTPKPAAATVAVSASPKAATTAATPAAASAPSSTIASTSRVTPAAASTATAVPLSTAGSTSAATAAVLASSVSLVPAAASSPSLSSSAANSVERMLTGLGAGALSGDIATVLQHSRQHSSLIQRIAQLETAAAAHSVQHAASQQRIAVMDSEQSAVLSAKLRALEQLNVAAGRELSQANELKCKAEGELADQRKKLRSTEEQLKQKAEQFEAQRAQLAAAMDQLAEQRDEVARMEAEHAAEHAELMALLHKREDTTGALISTVKIEKDEAKEAAELSSQHKRKAEAERDEVTKRARLVEDELEQKKEELKRFECAICLDAQANVVYQPCGHIAACVACDATYDGGPNRAAAAGLRSCPICRAGIKKATKTFGA